ncbi:MAG: pyruvate dehydrogenase (acetyl-transferring) E1 component subunit alpha [Myxococcales bacterium]|nr:pyruvate dehydrogenase (acetyl-transferring) E1 component subunit alpha [Myxococcales bacterium]
MTSDPALGLYRVLQDDGSVSAEPSLSEEQLLAMYRHMRQIRIMETRMVMLQRQGRIGFYGSCAGQEAPPIATGFATDPGDWVFPALRESAIMLVRGFPLVKYLAQVYGNSLDVLKGRQMPSHMSAREVNQVSWSSCIGPQIPQAVGAAWAAKIKGDGMVAIGFMGDGATSQPDFHNAINFAGVFKVPAVLICQNNHWSISVPTERQTASQTIAVKARAYGVPGVRVDGNDVLACYQVIREAVERARAGEGPTFIECVTYRMGAHSTSDDPTRYRSDDEVQEWAKKDPVERLRRYLVSKGLVDDAFDARVESEFGAELSAAIEEVEAAGPPGPETIFEDVYASRPWHLEEQLAELRAAGPAPKQH